MVGSNVCSLRWMGWSIRCVSGGVRRVVASCGRSAEEARIKRRVMQIVREADDEGDWRAAGCSSSAQWLAQVSSSDYRAAVRITRTSVALGSLPALDHALGTGVLTLDQVAAAAEFATPASDAELARVALGKPPSDDRAGGAHDRPADAGGRRGAVRAARAEHDAGRVGGASCASAAGCRSSRASRSSRRSGASPNSSARATSRPARSSTGGSRPPTRSSHSPASTAGAAVQTVESSAARRR